jgi:hypothetical protein
MYFWSYNKMPMSYKLKERYKAQFFYYVETFLFAYITMCIQYGLDTLLNLSIKSTFLIYKFILSTNKRDVSCFKRDVSCLPCLHCIF